MHAIKSTDQAASRIIPIFIRSTRRVNGAGQTVQSIILVASDLPSRIHNLRNIARSVILHMGAVTQPINGLNQLTSSIIGKTAITVRVITQTHQTTAQVILIPGAAGTFRHFDNPTCGVVINMFRRAIWQNACHHLGCGIIH